MSDDEKIAQLKEYLFGHHQYNTRGCKARCAARYPVRVRFSVRECDGVLLEWWRRFDGHLLAIAFVRHGPAHPQPAGILLVAPSTCVLLQDDGRSEMPPLPSWFEVAIGTRKS